MSLAITSDKISSLASAISGAGHIRIVTHFHPDGDALGSTTALLHYLKAGGADDVQVVLSSPAPDNLMFLAPEGRTDAVTDPEAAFMSIGEADLIFCLDFNAMHRSEALCPVLNGSKAKKILIDHHLNPDTGAFDLVFSETEISSASELLYRILMQMPDISGDAAKLPAEAARALMTGMTTDTNNFANSVFPGTLEMASELLAAGVDREFILDNIYRKHRENRLRALGYLLGQAMKITPSGVAYIIIDEETRARFDLRDGETEGFVNEPLAIAEVGMSILLKEDGDHFRVSVRSKRGISANALARDFFHGGGHEQAAGGKLFFPGDIEDKTLAADYIEKVTARFMQSEYRQQ